MYIYIQVSHCYQQEVRVTFVKAPLPFFFICRYSHILIVVYLRVCRYGEYSYTY